MINEHWKIPTEIAKKAEKIDFNDAVEKIENDNVFFKKEFIPSWYKGKSKKFPSFLLKKHENLKKADLIVEDLLFERYFAHKTPFFVKFPVSYKIVPVFIRNFVFSIINKAKKDTGFPQWPIDSSTDLIYEIYMKQIRKEIKKKIPYVNFWPNGKKFAVCLTHDLETGAAFSTIEKFRKIERKYGFVSTWNIVAKKYDIDFAKLQQLEKEGCEVALHGYNHNGKTPYLSKEKMKQRLTEAISKFKGFKILSFRSPQLQRSEKFLKCLSEYFICDSSIPDTDIKSAFAMRSGCCSVFPFMINNMVELPLTMPQDFRMIFSLKYSDADYFALWKEKVDYIKSLGGFVNVLTHADPYISGNDKKLAIYEKILKHISKSKNYYSGTMFEIGKWWIERSKSRIINGKIVGSKRAKMSYF